VDDVRSGIYCVPAQKLAAVVQRKVAAQRAALRLAKPFFGDLDRVPDFWGFDAAWHLLRCISHVRNANAKKNFCGLVAPFAMALSWWQLANASQMA